MAEPTIPPCGTCAGAREDCPVCGGTGKRLPRRAVPVRAQLDPDLVGFLDNLTDDLEALEHLDDPAAQRWLADAEDAATSLEAGALDDEERARLRRLGELL